MAGLRDPAYALLLLLGLCLVLLVSWPETLRLRNPQQVAELSSRSRLWRWLLTPSPLTSWQATGLRPLTAMTLAVALSMVAGSASYVASRAQDIRQHGAGNPVLVQFNGDTTLAARPARLLGSSSAFVFLWWPHLQRAEAVPLAAIKRLQAPVVARVEPGKPASAPVPVPAAGRPSQAPATTPPAPAPSLPAPR